MRPSAAAEVYTEPLRFGCYIHRPAAANAGIDLELGTHYDSLQAASAPSFRASAPSFRPTTNVWHHMR
eukprot:5337131-Alexandrium_andersonii.AAC.1